MSDIKDSGEIKQIIVITDGRSNQGISPVEAAAKAKKLGIAVSTIAVIESGSESDEKDIEEVEGIARAGGGLCEYTHIENLGRTMKLMTQKTAQKTIEQIVSRQLKSIVGVDMNELEPQSRFKIVDFIEKYGDSINLKCAVVLDTSGSMRSKLDTARKNLYELLDSLKARRGNSRLAVISYSGLGHQSCSIICGFTDDMEILRGRLEMIKAGGGTPTGPAIEAACQLILKANCESEQQEALMQNEIESCYV
ncbi:MAG: vWA domain-containing protein [Bacillota bacterium]